MANLIGTAPNQVPTNGSLGTMAFQDADEARIETPTIVDGFKLQHDEHNGTEYVQTNSCEFPLLIPRVNNGLSMTITSNVFLTYRPILVEMFLVCRANGTSAPRAYKRLWSMSTDTSNVVNISTLEEISSGVVAGDLVLANGGSRKFEITLANTTGYDNVSYSGYIRITTNDMTPITLTYTDPA